MARGEDKPQGRHVIEHAKSDRSKCHTCGGVIVEDELRLSEAFVSDEGKWARAHKSARTVKHRDGGDDFGERHMSAQTPDVWARFHHLACAAQREPYKLVSALKITSIEIPDRAEIERAIERAMSSVDVAEENAETRDEYLGFIERLRAGPDDDLVLVFGDWLQSVEDPRGALVAVQHAIETATGEDERRLVDEERKLLAEHRKYFLPERLEGTLVWRRGFVHRLAAKSVEQATTARVFEHSSLRLVREFAVATDGVLVIAANLPMPLPSTLRVVELGASYIGVVAPLLANALPQLERLKLSGTADIAALRHPTLAELELDCTDPTVALAATLRGDAVAQTDRITTLRRKDLPNVTRLILRATSKLDALVEALAGTDLLKGIKSLALRGDLSLDGMKPLLRKKLKLDVIDVRSTPITPLERDRLKSIAETVLVFEPPPPAAPPPPEKPRAWLVKHTRRPEWGIGRVIEETEAGLQVEFAEGGAKLVRNVELLEEVEAKD